MKSRVIKTLDLPSNQSFVSKSNCSSFFSQSCSKNFCDKQTVLVKPPLFGFMFFRLSYFMDSDTCVKQCYPTEEFISKSKKIYHQCSFSYPFLFTKFQFFLATNCSLKQEVDSCAKCKQKSKNIFKYETEQTSSKGVV